jgi:L-fucose isomerase-like protein
VLGVDSEEFEREINEFAGVCRIVDGVKGARLGSIGARTAPFNTVRYSEKILEKNEVSVETIDLSEILGQARSLNDESREAKSSLEEIEEYVETESVPKDSLIKIAKLKWVLNRWVEENDLDATAIQCWSALEEYYGVVPCTAMSMMSEDLFPSACEVDVMGALGMYILELGSGKPAALTDFNNNYGEDEDKLVTFHCSNFPASFIEEPEMSYQDILANDLGKDRCYGTMVGRISPGPATFFRLSTADTEGKIRSYLAEGKYTDDELDTFGGYGVARIEGLQKLMRHVTDNGFEHHVAVTRSRVGASIEEALNKYLDWEVYFHGS